jgi:hypothetical protein
VANRLEKEFADSQMEQKKNQLEELLDNGNTLFMNLSVLNSTPPMASEVYSELIMSSPYVSDTVLKSAIYKENVLPNAMVRDVLIANPQSAKNNEIMVALDERINPMPVWMKEQVKEGVNIKSAKESLESDIRSWDRKRSEHFENIYQRYRKDTVNIQASTDSLISLLQQDNRMESKYRLAFIRMEQGEWSEVQTVINSVPSAFDLTPIEESVHQDYVSLFTVLNQLNGSYPTEGSQEASELELLASKDENYPGACARNMLIAAGLMDYEEPVILPEEEFKCTEVIENNGVKSKKPDVLNVFPNPASDYLIIDYNAEDYKGEITIEANDIYGKLLFTKKYTIRLNQEILSTVELHSGVYSVSLMINGEIIESKKITIQH